ncbi:MAG: hypothetical protein MJ252_04360 [archaeon]|nr:hypothetical protein [archaeon]
MSLETRLFEEIIQPTGIAVKPSVTLLNDYCRRAKNLNRDTMFNNIMEKLNAYKNYVASPEDIKMLTKCLYLVEAICENKVIDLYDAFEEQLELLDNIRSTYSNNRKIVDLVGHIFKIYNPGVNEEGYSNINRRKISGEGENAEVTGNTGGNNPTLIDMGEEENNEGGNQDQNTGNTLDDIFGGNNSKGGNTNPSSGGNLLDFGMGNETSNNNSSNINSLFGNFNQGNPQPLNNNPQNNNIGGGLQLDFIQQSQPQMQSQSQPQSQPTENKKSFGFIKAKSKPIEMSRPNMPNISSNEPQTQPEKKGFKFIKSKPTEQPQFNNPGNDLNSVFASPVSADNIQINPQNMAPTVDLTKVKFEPKFDYDMVNQNISGGTKEQKEKDPFNFVDDMLKVKK